MFGNWYFYHDAFKKLWNNKQNNVLEEEIKESLSKIISDFELIVKRLHEMSYLV